MKETYKLIITLLNEIEYEGIIAKIDNKIYIRSQIDNDDYESMIKEMLLGIGDIQIKDCPNNPDDFCIHQKKFNSLDEFFIDLKNSGFDIEFEKIEENSKSFSLIAEGDDISLETIAYKKEAIPLINLAQTMFYMATNNITYEPKINIKNGSFIIDVQEKINLKELEKIIIHLNRGEIDKEKYFSNNLYKKLIDNIVQIAKIKTLKTLNIELLDKTISLNINSIKTIRKQLSTIINSKLFNEIISYTQLRAFDEQKKKVILDSIEGIFYLHLNNDVFKKLYEYYKNKTEKINIRGYFKSVKTIDIHKVIKEEK